MGQKWIGLVLTFAVCAHASSSFSFKQLPHADENLTSWANNSRPIFFNRLLDNFSPEGALPGTILAAPSKQNPDYYYHWVRDSALVMQLVLNEYQKTESQSLKEKYLQLINNYIDFSRLTQLAPESSGGIAAPRFFIKRASSR